MRTDRDGTGYFRTSWALAPEHRQAIDQACRFKAKTISTKGAVSDGGGQNPVSGYSVIKADSLDAAVTLAKGCPVLLGGGTIEVAETFNAM